MSCITEEQLKKEINIIRLLLKYEIPVIETDKEYLISYYVQKLQIDLTESRGRVDGIDLERSFTLYSELEELYDIAKDLEKKIKEYARKSYEKKLEDEMKKNIFKRLFNRKKALESYCVDPSKNEVYNSYINRKK